MWAPPVLRKRNEEFRQILSTQYATNPVKAFGPEIPVLEVNALFTSHGVHSFKMNRHMLARVPARDTGDAEEMQTCPTSSKFIVERGDKTCLCTDTRYVTVPHHVLKCQHRATDVRADRRSTGSAWPLMGGEGQFAEQTVLCDCLAAGDIGSHQKHRPWVSVCNPNSGT